MAQAWLYVCDGTRGETVNAFNGAAHGTCSPADSGAWTLIEYAEPAQVFDVADLDPATLAAAFGAGFVVMATPLIMAWAVRVIIDMARNW